MRIGRKLARTAMFCVLPGSQMLIPNSREAAIDAASRKNVKALRSTPAPAPYRPTVTVAGPSAYAMRLAAMTDAELSEECTRAGVTAESRAEAIAKLTA